MKIERLKIFRQQLESELARNDVKSDIYYRYGSKWYDLNSESTCPDSLTKDLEKSTHEKIALHASSSLFAWFFLSSQDVCVRLKFAKSPQLVTRKKYREEITKIQERSNTDYKVSHNPLTHLLARDEFRLRLSKSIYNLQENLDLDPEAQVNDVPSTIAVMALDIDHFKQVNDTWGHLYGDQVLKSFARRLDDCAARIRTRDSKSSTEIILGHPSGEEFLIFIRSNSVPDQFIEWANEFRKFIADGPLPNATEWNWLTGTGEAAPLSPPPLHERTIRTSIGIAFHNSSAQVAPGIDAVSDILERADTALYRAKSGGRNQVISYDDILLNCGRVIEQDQRTGVVAIDIGSNVGVEVGQEFRVFLPTFSGKAKFIVNDGRTKRTLGTYPRVESARIVVFDAQPEIAFSYIAPPDNSNAVLDIGCHLEAIPAGSIGHLLPSSSRYAKTIDHNDVEQMQKFIRESSTSDDTAFAVVVKLTREAEYLRKYGSVSLNVALAQLYKSAKDKFRYSKFIEVLDAGSICISGNSSNYDEEQVSDFVFEIARDLPELGILAGVFSKDYSGTYLDDQCPLDPAHALEFARFASTDIGRSGDASVRHFNYGTAVKVLNTLRESRAYETAQADLNRLRDMGVSSASISNIGGLIYANLGQRQEALDFFLDAASMDDSKIIYKSNFVTVAFTLDQIETSINLMKEVSDEDVSNLITDHPWGYFCYARVLARAKLERPGIFDVQRFMLIADKALQLEQFSENPSWDIINDVLLEIRHQESSSP